MFCLHEFTGWRPQIQGLDSWCQRKCTRCGRKETARHDWPDWKVGSDWMGQKTRTRRCKRCRKGDETAAWP
jgi:hypothetical protein